MQRSAHLLVSGVVCALALASCSEPEPLTPSGDQSRGPETTATSRAVTAGDCGADISSDEAPAKHVANGTDVTYDGVPPVSGVHWSRWPDIQKVLYVAAERPELAELVHSQEHGWTFVWYDESIADDADAMAGLEELADDVEQLSKTAIVPWTSDDGEAFPDGAHVALTHWSDTDETGTEWREFCPGADLEAVTAFTQRHPSTDAHEPNGP